MQDTPLRLGPAEFTGGWDWQELQAAEIGRSYKWLGPAGVTGGGLREVRNIIWEQVFALLDRPLVTGGVMPAIISSE